MTIVQFIATVLSIAVNLYIALMFARLVLELARAFARQWRPRGVGLVLAEFVYTVTDPPVKLVRRILPPLRLGGVALDFSLSVVLIALFILSTIIAVFL